MEDKTLEILATIFAVIASPILANLLNRFHVSENLHASYNALLAVAMSLVYWFLATHADMSLFTAALERGLAIAGLSSVLLATYKGKYSGRPQSSG